MTVNELIAALQRHVEKDPAIGELQAGTWYDPPYLLSSIEETHGSGMAYCNTFEVDEQDGVKYFVIAIDG